MNKKNKVPIYVKNIKIQKNSNKVTNFHNKTFIHRFHHK